MSDPTDRNDLQNPPPSTGGEAEAPHPQGSAGPGSVESPAAPPRHAAPPGYGAPTPPPVMDPRDPRIKSPVLACILSVVPGLGQIYVGYYVRGFVHAITVGVLISTAVAIDPQGEALASIIGMFTVFFWLYNIIDAGRKASLYNLALQGKETIDLPSDFTMPAFRGSIGAGVALVILGVVLLTHTKWQISLDWVREWWPLLPIGLGLWLIVKAIQDRASE